MSSIKETTANQARRLRLRVLAKAMLSVAVCAVVFVLFAFFFSGEDERPRVPALKVDVSTMMPGETRRLLWERRPVLIQRRTQEMITALQAPEATAGGRLRDPDSLNSEQPEPMKNALRSREPEWFVAIALGTDQGCPIRDASDSTQENANDTAGAGQTADPAAPGFMDECRGSLYDGAGRVLTGQYADRNLAVPSYVLEVTGTQLTVVLGR